MGYILHLNVLFSTL